MEHNKQQNTSSRTALYNEDTDPGFINATAPIPGYHLPPETRTQRLWRATRSTSSLVIRKINQLLTFALNVLLLILFIRLLLIAFGLTTSLFTSWIYMLSTPFIIPFENFLPVLHYGQFAIDLSTIAAMIAYVILVALVRRLFLVLFARP
jgi:uncharacterized protein YggT (Ycf19 family)